ncbi:MAG: glycosyltransferase [Methylotenera sp.]|nr:glycosyltransferase [Oligoflexia bacterium]
MLGWEYPPRYAGGLGKACRGFSQALARQGAQVHFVLPTFPNRISEERLEVVGARECLIEAGWPDTETPTEVPTEVQRKAGSITHSKSPAELLPYGRAPETPMPEHIRKIFESRIFSTPGNFGKALRDADPEPSVSVTEASSADDYLGTGYEDHEFNEDTEAVAASLRERILAAPLSEAQVPPPELLGANAEIYGKNLWSEIEKFCFSVRQLAEFHEVDVVHAHDWMTFPAAFEYQRITGVPVFLHVHATEYDRSGDVLNSDVFRIEREAFNRAAHIFAVSKYTAGIIERLYGIHRRKISVLYNAPDEATQTLLTAPDAEREPMVIFLGRMTFQKGPDHFLKAAALVAEVIPEARFLMIGTGDLNEQMRALAHSLGIEKRVQFTGFMNPAQVDAILGQSKVLVMPSISEPFGLVALEAIHNGIPVILSKQSGVREVLSRALQVDFWDHEKLADQMIAALRLPELSKQLVEEGMAQVRALSWDDSAIKALHTYERFTTPAGNVRQKAPRGSHGN